MIWEAIVNISRIFWFSAGSCSLYIMNVIQHLRRSEVVRYDYDLSSDHYINTLPGHHASHSERKYTSYYREDEIITEISKPDPDYDHRALYYE